MKRSTLAVLFLLIVSTAASAATVSFTDRAAWLADATGAGLQTDTPLNLDALVMTGDFNVVAQISGGGLVITPSAGTQLVVADRDAPGYDFGAPQVISAQLGFPSSLMFNLAPGTFGIALDVGAFPAPGEVTDLSVSITTAAALQTFDFTGLGGSSLSFVGFTSDSQIVSVALTGGFADPVFANITTAGVPEPGTGFLLSGAVGALLLWRWRRS